MHVKRENAPVPVRRCERMDGVGGWARGTHAPTMRSQSDVPFFIIPFALVPFAAKERGRNPLPSLLETHYIISKRDATVTLETEKV